MRYLQLGYLVLIANLDVIQILTYKIEIFQHFNDPVML